MSNKIDYKKEYNTMRKEYRLAYEENIMFREKDYKDISDKLDYDISQNILQSFELDIRIGIDTSCDMDGTMCIKRPILDKYIQNYIKQNYLIDI